MANSERHIEALSQAAQGKGLGRWIRRAIDNQGATFLNRVTLPTALERMEELQGIEETVLEGRGKDRIQVSTFDVDDNVYKTGWEHTLRRNRRTGLPEHALKVVNKGASPTRLVEKPLIDEEDWYQTPAEIARARQRSIRSTIMVAAGGAGLAALAWVGSIVGPGVMDIWGNIQDKIGEVDEVPPEGQPEAVQVEELFAPASEEVIERKCAKTGGFGRFSKAVEELGVEEGQEVDVYSLAMPRGKYGPVSSGEVDDILGPHKFNAGEVCVRSEQVENNGVGGVPVDTISPNSVVPVSSVSSQGARCVTIESGGNAFRAAQQLGPNVTEVVYVPNKGPKVAGPVSSFTKVFPGDKICSE